ncbi:MAG: hypothetical protein Q9179_002955 [Wetmoreana sp. 5 TL-2023]
MPKPVVFTHATATANMRMSTLEPPPGFESQDRMYQGNRVYITFPPFHGAYLVSFLFNAIQFGTTMIAPLSGTIPSGEGLVAGLRNTSADVAIIVPSIIQDLAQNPELLEFCSCHLRAILYCGGDLPDSTGNIVASKLTLLNQFGATELGLTSSLISTRDRALEDWKYVHFHPDLGLEMRHFAEDTYELYVVRSERLREYQPTFTIFPHLQEYASRDLFVRHPSPDKKTSWKWKARADDIIVFLNGEKTNPISMEQHIVSKNPDVGAALVIGAQRFQAALLLEPAIDGKELTAPERAAFIESVWPDINEANHNVPSHARIAKSQILLTRPGKPMIRAGKGTVQRAGTLNAYADEINALYRDADETPTHNHPYETATILPVDQRTLCKHIRESIMSVTGWTDLDDDQNLFALGMDSLHAIMLIRHLKGALTLPNFAPSTVYSNPSVSALTRAISALQTQKQEAQSSSNQDQLLKRSALLQEYKDRIAELQAPPISDGRLVSSVAVLTGSTGALGSYILDSLLNNPSVTHVYCLNRASDSARLQTIRNRDRHMPTDLPADRITFCTCDLSKPDLGLPSDTYSELTSSCITVIHNAWPVNFNLSTDSFRPQLDSVVNLTKLVASSKQSSQLVFISSISSVMAHGIGEPVIPEAMIDIGSRVHANGYAESKYLSEHLIHYACERLSAHCAILRVGQLAGAVKSHGTWNPAEWFPSLVISSAHVGALPESLGAMLDNIDWVPIDLLAESAVEIAFAEFSSEPPAAPSKLSSNTVAVYNLVSPNPVQWETLRLAVSDALSHLLQKPIGFVTSEVWMKKIHEDLESMVSDRTTIEDRDVENTVQLNPAAKLLQFYEDSLSQHGGAAIKWEMKETLRQSKTLRQLQSIQRVWLQNWMEAWLRPLKTTDV